MEDKVNDMFYGAAPIIFKQARVLRRHETKAEKILWNRLSNKKLEVKFRRQHPINQFIVDFYCHELKLVVEVDGKIHLLKENKEYDEMRTKALNYYNIKVVRFVNEDIFADENKVLDLIKLKIKEIRKPYP